MKILMLIEDNADIRELVGIVLRRRGYEVCEAENGQDALDLMSSMNPPPSLLLLDLMMPVMSGYELLQILEQRKRLDGLPVVVVSAAGDYVNMANVSRVLRKPIDPKTIVAVVQEICGDP